MGVVEAVLNAAKEKGMKEGLEEGLKEGIQKGIEKGLSEGALEKTKKVVLRLIEQYPSWTDQQVADIVEMDIEFVREMRK